MLKPVLTAEDYEEIFNQDQMDQLCQKIHQANRIIIQGSDESMSCLLRFQGDMITMDKLVVQNSMYENHFNSLDNQNLNILFSLSGNITKLMSHSIQDNLKQHDLVMVGYQKFYDTNLLLKIPDYVDDALQNLIVIIILKIFLIVIIVNIMLISKLYFILASSKLSSYEYIIAKYFIDHLDDLENLKLKDMINETHISKSTITRFIKDIGYNGFLDIQYQLISENLENNINENIEVIHINDLQKVKSILVVGNAFSVSSLLIYKSFFKTLNIDYQVRIYTGNNDSLEDEMVTLIDSETLVILVSLDMNIRKIVADPYCDFYNYMNLIKSNTNQYIYVGEKDDTYYDENQTFHISQALPYSKKVEKLCQFIENIYLLMK